MAKKKKPQTLRSEMIKLLQDDSGAASIFYSCLEDTNDTLQSMSDEELINTFIFMPPDSIRERFQSLVDTLKPFKNIR